MSYVNFVYLTTNTANGKVYVGIHSTKNINDGYLGSGLALLRAIEKYGAEKFTRKIIAFTDTREEALELEELIVDLDWVDDPNNYNLKVGGRGHGSYEGTRNPNYGQGHKQRGRRNGRHRDNFKGDLSVVGENISRSLINSPLNKKELNPAAQLYYVTLQSGEIINIRRGYLRNFCEEYGANYNVVFNTLYTGKPVSRSKYKGAIGMLLSKGRSDEASKIYPEV